MFLSVLINCISIIVLFICPATGYCIVPFLGTEQNKECEMKNKYMWLYFILSLKSNKIQTSNRPHEIALVEHRFFNLMFGLVQTERGNEELIHVSVCCSPWGAIKAFLYKSKAGANSSNSCFTHVCTWARCCMGALPWQH